MTFTRKGDLYNQHNYHWFVVGLLQATLCSFLRYISRRVGEYVQGGMDREMKWPWYNYSATDYVDFPQHYLIEEAIDIYNNQKIIKRWWRIIKDNIQTNLML